MFPFPESCVVVSVNCVLQMPVVNLIEVSMRGTVQGKFVKARRLLGMQMGTL